MIDTSNKEIQSHYDFIVVGAGAAGCPRFAPVSWALTWASLYTGVGRM
jgi:hypothetical protein